MAYFNKLSSLSSADPLKYGGNFLKLEMIRGHEGQQGLRGPSRRFQLRKGAGSANAGLNGIVYAQKYKSDYARE